LSPALITEHKLSDTISLTNDKLTLEPSRLRMNELISNRSSMNETGFYEDFPGRSDKGTGRESGRLNSDIYT